MERILLDNKEEEALKRLTYTYQQFMQPSLASLTANAAKNKLSDVTPDYIKEVVSKGFDGLTEADVWKQVMKMAADGFLILESVSSKYSINESKIIKDHKKNNPEINSLDQIKYLKGYEIEKLVNSLDWKTYLLTIMQSAPTGAAGIAGLPFNIVLSTFIQFRSVQLTAMYYGYDIKNSPEELEYAGSVLLNIISKGKIADTGGFDEIIAKMMSQAELTSLRNALSKSSANYAKMAAEGGLKQMYVKIRAITNKAAVKALENANVKGIENKVLRKLLESLSKNMAKKSGAKSIPAASALLSVLIDTHQINKVLRLANVIYHKRFLLEKEIRSIPDIDLSVIADDLVLEAE